MLAYLRAKFDMTEILSFNFNVISNVLTVHGRDSNGTLKVEQDRMDKVTAARLFRLYVKELAGL